MPKSRRVFVIHRCHQDAEFFRGVFSDAVSLISHCNGGFQYFFSERFTDIIRVVERFGNRTFGNAELSGDIVDCRHSDSFLKQGGPEQGCLWAGMCPICSDVDSYKIAVDCFYYTEAEEK